MREVKGILHNSKLFVGLGFSSLFYTLDLKTLKWTRLSVSNSEKVPDLLAGYAMVKVLNSIILYGGFSAKSIFQGKEVGSRD
jgi:N-acetylneuraminic acid mutarotase